MSSPTRHDVERWTSSGCRSLTGPGDRPGLGPPRRFVTALDRVAARMESASRAVGTAVHIDPLGEIAMRGHLAGLRRQGATSCGGATRMVRSRDGLVALALARPDDVDLVPALIEHEVNTGLEAAWEAIAACAATMSALDLVERCTLLGVAAAQVGSTPSSASGADHDLRVASTPRDAATVRPCSVRRRLRVVDLSALWAGPLCAQLLGLAGCDVVKVESVRRPDGARSGHPAVYARLNSGKRSVSIDPATSQGLATVRALLAAADVVVEASRARALAAWGAGPNQITGPRVWVSITGHGYVGENANRIGFGDDVAAAAGLVATGPGGPWFCGDAIADPLSGMVAATAVLEALADARPCHLDVAMVEVARQFAGRTVDAAAPSWTPADDTSDVEFPTMTGEPADLGAETHEVMAEWCR